MTGSIKEYGGPGVKYRVYRGLRQMVYDWEGKDHIGLPEGRVPHTLRLPSRILEGPLTPIPFHKPYWRLETTN